VSSSSLANEIARCDAHGDDLGEVVVREFVAWLDCEEADTEPRAPLCRLCGQPMRWVPPGYSQSKQRHYNGFWGCERWREPDHQQVSAPRRIVRRCQATRVDGSACAGLAMHGTDVCWHHPDEPTRAQVGKLRDEVWRRHPA
jgi:hypothetical protein